MGDLAPIRYGGNPPGAEIESSPNLDGAIVAMVGCGIAPQPPHPLYLLASLQEAIRLTTGETRHCGRLTSP